MRRSPSPGDLVGEIAATFVTAGKLDAAIRFLSRHQSLATCSGDARRLADYQAKAGALEAARETLLHALEVWPVDAGIHADLANLYVRSFDIRAAQRHFDWLLRTDPRRIDVVARASRSAIVLHEFELAAAFVDRHEGTTHTDPRLVGLRREIEAARLRWSRAAASFARAYGEGPVDRLALQRAIAICLSARSLDAARHGALRLIALFPTELDGWLTAFWLHMRIFDFAVAYEIAWRLWRRFPNSPKVFFLIGRSLLSGGRYEDAALFYGAASDRVQATPGFLKDRLRIASARRRDDEAAALADSATRREGDEGPEADAIAIIRCRAAVIAGRRGQADLATAADVRARELQGGVAATFADLQSPSFREPPRLLNRGGLRVALCISGQLRGFRHAYETVVGTALSALGPDVRVDTFVHTWESVSDGFGSTLNVSRALPLEIAQALATEDIQVDRFRDLFPRAFALIRKPERVSRAEIADFYAATACEVEDDSMFVERFFPTRQPRERPMINSLKMFYKMFACDRLRHAHEERHGIAYDIVVRWRPDLPVESWNARELLGLVRDGLGVCANYATRDGFGDQFAIGRPEVMTAYASVWPHILAAQSTGILPGCEGVYGEVLLLNYLLAVGIEMRQARLVRFGELRGSVPDRGALVQAMLADLAEGDRSRDRSTLAARLRALV